MEVLEAYDKIRVRYDGDDDPPRFVIHRHGLILALCLHSEQHPRICADPSEVWVGDDLLNESWGEILAWDTGAVPVYVTQCEDMSYRRRGIYHVIGSTVEPLELARRMAFPSIPRLTRVVFLSGPHEPILE